MVAVMVVYGGSFQAGWLFVDPESVSQSLFTVKTTIFSLVAENDGNCDNL